MRVGQKAHIHYDIGINRQTILETKRYDFYMENVIIVHFESVEKAFP